MKKIVLIFFLMVGIVLKSQPPARFYTKYGGEGTDKGYGVQEIYNRQYIVTGSSSSFGDGSTDAYLLLVDSMAGIVWQKKFGGVGADVGKSVIFNPSDSGFIFAGFTSSFGNGGFDVYVVRTDKAGTLKWQSSFGGLDWDFGSDLAFASDGNLIVCGNTYSSGYGKNDGYIAKVNINTGALMREKWYGGMEDDEFNRIKPTSDGNLCLSGNTKSYGDLNNDFWFFKINNNCDSVKSLAIGNANKAERCYDFIEDKNNDLAFCGSYDTSFYNVGKNVSYVLKTNLNGVYISDFKVSGNAGTNDAMFSSITNAKQGNDYLCSSKFYFSAVYGDEIFPYLISPGYIFLQATTYGDIGDDESFKVINTKDNGFLIVGYCLGPNKVTNDVFLLKLDNTILGTNPYVGISETETIQQVSKIYYYENVIYLDNKRHNVLTYQIVNSHGAVMQTGVTDSDLIPVNPNLAKDIYLVRILEKQDIRLKFIKD